MQNFTFFFLLGLHSGCVSSCSQLNSVCSMRFKKNRFLDRLKFMSSSIIFKNRGKELSNWNVKRFLGKPVLFLEKKVKLQRKK